LVSLCESGAVQCGWEQWKKMAVQLESGSARWGMKLMGGARIAVTGGRKDVTPGMHNPDEKAPSVEYAKVAQG
jgi:hypothetical protein